MLLTKLDTPSPSTHENASSLFPYTTTNPISSGVNPLDERFGNGTVHGPEGGGRIRNQVGQNSISTYCYPKEADLESICREWHFHIYFHQRNADEHHAALELRDAVLRLRRDGAFVAVPLFRVNTDPIGPHPVGSYEIWCPSESFASVYSYLALNRGDLSVLIHPLTREEWMESWIIAFQRKDHEVRHAWLGPAFPLDLSALPVKSDNVPLQYPSLKLGYSSTAPKLSLEERKRIGGNVEQILRHEKEAAKAPSDQ
uniref:DNA topoisomerase 1 ) n=1 Tax=Ganoderma boninense TaxID=34458 RepID=A0A5K1JVB5_9APHY|nr:DNA topoisomerase 1 (EC (DNA topoisomerase I) [Ganoderma boninense]